MYCTLIYLCTVPLLPYPSQDQEVFFDTFTTPTIRKKIKRLGNQDEKESRRIWRYVTESLAGKDVEAATDAKHTVSHALMLFFATFIAVDTSVIAIFESL